MRSLSHLGMSAVPKILLTATLVPRHEQVLAEYLGVSMSPSESKVLRSSTARPNHFFQFAGVPSFNHASASARRLASLLLEGWNRDPDHSVRGIIFVKSVAKVLSLQVACPFPTSIYHGQMTDEEKDSQLSVWSSGEGQTRWIIATTALLHGVDYPRVDAVIFLENPYGLYDFVQGAGRAGRSGQRSLVAIIHETPLPYPPVPPQEYQCDEEVRALIQSSACRRTAISQVMDTEVTSCAILAGSVRCDNCEGHLHPVITSAITNPPLAPVTPLPVLNTSTAPSDFIPRSPPIPPPASLLRGKVAQQRYQARQEHAKKTRDLISRLSGCFVCRIFAPEHRPCHPSCGLSDISSCSYNPHIPYTCPTAAHRSGWIDWKKKLPRYPKDVKRCFFCGLPDSILTTGQHTADLPAGVKCRYSDTMICAAWHILNTPDLLRGVQTDLGFSPGPDLASSFGNWLISYGLESEDIRLFSVFSWLCKKYYPHMFPES